eukprot:6081814-Prymnesium_polylepis.1
MVGALRRAWHGAKDLPLAAALPHEAPAAAATVPPPDAESALLASAQRPPPLPYGAGAKIS